MGLREATWLPGAGRSDPYCVVEIPGKPHTKARTQIIPNTANPYWNYEHTIVDYAPGDALLFTVWESKPIQGDRAIGRVSLVSDQFYPDGLTREVMLEGTGVHETGLPTPSY